MADTPITEVADMVKRTCSIGDCERLAWGKGWCNMHYQRVRKTGSPDPKPKLTPEDRFWGRVVPTGFCWEWTGGSGEEGYGRFWLDGRNVMAYRFAYETLVGPIPEGLHIDHLCRNPSCVNPDHLEPVSAAENTLRGFSTHAVNARKTHCKRGHPLSGENVAYTKDGTRQCLTCKRARNAKWMRDNYVKPTSGSR